AATIDRPGGVDVAGARDVERQNRRDGFTLVAQGLIGGVLDNRDVELAGEIQQPLATGEVEGFAGWIGEVGGNIGEFYPSAGCRRRGGIGGWRAISGEVEPVIGRLIGVKGLKGAQIGWPGDEGRIVRRKKKFAKIIKALL